MIRLKCIKTCFVKMKKDSGLFEIFTEGKEYKCSEIINSWYIDVENNMNICIDIHSKNDLGKTLVKDCKFCVIRKCNSCCNNRRI